MLGLVKAEASPVWPPAGIALAALISHGRWMWPGITLGSLWLNLSASVSIPGSVIVTSALTATLQALIGKALLTRFGFSPQLERLRDVLALAVGAALLSTLVGATVSNLSACIFEWAKWSHFWHNWWTMWVGDGMGILVITPSLFLIKNFQFKINQLNSFQWNFSNLICNSLEPIVLWGLLASSSWLVFGSKTQAAIAQYPLEYLPFPLVAWAALRFGQRGAVASSLIVSAIAIFGAVQGGGPFLAKSENLSQAILFLQTFMAVITLTALVLAAAVAERQQALVEMRRVASLLRSSEASLANAQRIALLGNWDWEWRGPQAGQLRWSDELYRLLGFAPGSFKPSQEAFLQAVHPDDRELVERSLQGALFERKPYCLDYRIILPDGSERFVCEQSAIKLTGITATVQDVTERKTAEIALRVSAERERLLGEMALRIRQSLDLKYILNTTVAEVRQFLKADRVFVGYLDQPETLSATSMRTKVLAESVAPDYPSILGWCLSADESYLAELRQFYASHRHRIVSDTSQIEPLAPLKTYYTDYQVRATLNVPIVEGEKLFGLLVVNQCSGPRQWQQFEIDFLEQLATQVAIAIQQAQLLQQVQTLNANLERQVEERTYQLQKAVAELQESNQLKDLFLHAVSHNLRTPVMGMLMLLKNLLSKSVRANHDTIPVPRSLLERMVQGSEHQLSMVNSLLDAHEGEVNGLALNCESVQLQPLWVALTTDLQPQLQKNQATLTADLPVDLPVIHADPHQLRRVFENLLTNALKHNPPGVHISLKAEVVEVEEVRYWTRAAFPCSPPILPCSETSGNLSVHSPHQKSKIPSIRCTITDNGVGISKKQCEHLFKLRVQDPNHRQLTGLGLGLYLSRQIIAAHGGQIGVNSTPGIGSAFWFTLPLTQSVENDEIELNTQGLPTGEPRSHL